MDDLKRLILKSNTLMKLNFPKNSGRGPGRCINAVVAESPTAGTLPEIMDDAKQPSHFRLNILTH